eukprot:4000206-Amphidinium_carterae.1
MVITPMSARRVAVLTALAPNYSSSDKPSHPQPTASDNFASPVVLILTIYVTYFMLCSIVSVLISESRGRCHGFVKLFCETMQMEESRFSRSAPSSRAGMGPAPFSERFSRAPRPVSKVLVTQRSTVG